MYISQVSGERLQDHWSSVLCFISASLVSFRAVPGRCKYSPVSVFVLRCLFCSFSLYICNSFSFSQFDADNTPESLQHSFAVSSVLLHTFAGVSILPRDQFLDVFVMLY